jgi:hypothetical protein
MRLNFGDSFQRTWVSVGVAGVSAGLSIYKGLHAESQDKKAAREGAAMKRPFYSIPSEDIINRNIYGNLATQGLTSGEKQYSGEQRERGLATSTHALSETGAGVNQFGELNQVFADSLKSQSALDAQEHKQNIDMFTKANSEISAQKGIQFGINELQPYESKLKEIQDRRIAAKTNENNAVNEGIGSLSAAATGVNSYMKTNPGTPAQPDYSKVTPYNRTFGLSDTGGGTAGSPAANINYIDPKAPDITKVGQLPNYWNTDQDISTLE